MGEMPAICEPLCGRRPDHFLRNHRIAHVVQHEIDHRKKRSITGQAICGAKPV